MLLLWSFHSVSSLPITKGPQRATESPPRVAATSAPPLPSPHLPSWGAKITLKRPASLCRLSSCHLRKKKKKKKTRQAEELEERNPVWLDTFQVCKSGKKKKKKKKDGGVADPPTAPPQPRWDGDLSLRNPEESRERPASSGADEAESENEDVRRGCGVREPGAPDATLPKTWKMWNYLGNPSGKEAFHIQTDQSAVLLPVYSGCCGMRFPATARGNNSRGHCPKPAPHEIQGCDWLAWL